MRIPLAYLAAISVQLLYLLSFVLPPIYIWTLSLSLAFFAAAIPGRSIIDLATRMLWWVQREPPATDILMVLGFAKAILSGIKLRFDSSGYPLVLMMLFAVLNIVQISWSSDWARAAFYAAVTVYTMLVLPFVFWKPEKLLCENCWAEALAFAIDLTALALIVAGAAAALGFGDNFPWLYHTQNRARAFFKDVNVAGPFVIMGALRILSQLMIAGRYSATSSARLTIYAMAIALTFSRGAYLNYAVGISIIGLIAIYKRRGWRFALFSLLILSVGAVYLPRLIIEYDQQRVIGINSYDTQGRFASWKSGLMMALDHPLGIGPGQYEVLSPEYQHRFIGNATVTPSAHSMYIRLAAENGALGVAVFFAAMVWILIGLIKNLKYVKHASRPCIYESAWLLATIVGIAAEGVVIDVIHWRHFGIALGLAMYFAGICRPVTGAAGVGAGGIQ